VRAVRALGSGGSVIGNRARHPVRSRRFDIGHGMLRCKRTIRSGLSVEWTGNCAP
jgi:hypothetical protein